MTRALKKADGAFLTIIHAEDSSPGEASLVSSLIDGLPGATSFASLRSPSHMLFEGSGDSLVVLDPLSHEEAAALAAPDGTIELLLAVPTSDYLDSFGGGSDGCEEEGELSLLREAAFAEPGGFAGAAWVTLGPVSADRTAVGVTFALDADHPDHQEDS